MAMLWASRAAAQGSSAAVADSSPFRPLSLPAPNLVRGGAGRPGPRYWQQRADYRIEATLDPERNEVRASETVHYVNNSPDALPYLWMFVEQNLCAPTSITNVLNQPPLVFLGSAFDFSCQGFAGGLTLDYVRRPGVSGRGGRRPRIDRAETHGVRHHDARRSAAAARARERASTSISDGASTCRRRAAAGWDTTVRSTRSPSGTRAWCVYDDVHGWNHEPYIGAGEFYLEYGSFDVRITVPASYLVAATGQLRNSDSVLTATERARLLLARRSDTAIAIVVGERGRRSGQRPGREPAGRSPGTTPRIRCGTWRSPPDRRCAGMPVATTAS